MLIAEVMKVIRSTFRIAVSTIITKKHPKYIQRTLLNPLPRYFVSLTSKVFYTQIFFEFEE